MSAPVILRTEHLLLEPLAPADFGALRALFSLESVREFLLDGEVPSDEWVVSVITDSAADFERRGLGFWVAREQGAHGACGVVGFRDFHDPPVEELVYALAPESCGRGFATEMGEAAVEYAFEIGRDRVLASVDLPNEASNRVLRRLGFREVRRESRPEGCLWDQIHWEKLRG